MVTNVRLMKYKVYPTFLSFHSCLIFVKRVILVAEVYADFFVNFVILDRCCKLLHRLLLYIKVILARSEIQCAVHSKDVYTFRENKRPKDFKHSGKKVGHRYSPRSTYKGFSLARNKGTKKTFHSTNN